MYTNIEKYFYFEEHLSFFCCHRTKIKAMSNLFTQHDLDKQQKLMSGKNTYPSTILTKCAIYKL